MPRKGPLVMKWANSWIVGHWETDPRSEFRQSVTLRSARHSPTIDNYCNRNTTQTKKRLPFFEQRLLILGARCLTDT